MSPQALFIVWICLAFLNLIIQLCYFFRDKSGLLYIGKRVTTPLLLFGGMVSILLSGKPAPFIPLLILGLMGVGEIGIEGSSVVEKRNEQRKPSLFENIMVTAAGIVFLAVNIILGISLMPGNNATLLIGMGLLSILLLFFLNFYFALSFKPDNQIKFQTRVYSLGLIVLYTGALADLFSRRSPLGTAALILSISDTLVLIRMAAEIDKDTPKGKTLLFMFLFIILILYYIYMGVLIRIGMGLSG